MAIKQGVVNMETTMTGKTILSAVVAFFMLSGGAIADPAPFGLEIGKATIQEAKKKYTLKNNGVNNYSNGEQYLLDVKDITLEGAKSIDVIFGQDEKLQGVVVTLHKGRFNPLMESLQKKYKLTKSNVAFVGDSSATFSDGNTKIFLNAPHMSFVMTMEYVTKELVEKYSDTNAKEAQQKKQEEVKQL